MTSSAVLEELEKEIVCVNCSKKDSCCVAEGKVDNNTNTKALQ